MFQLEQSVMHTFSSILDELYKEFPKHVSLIDEISPEYTTLEFWRNNAVAVPKLVMVAGCVAAVERILQILEEETVTTMSEDSLDSIKTFLEFAYRELV